MAREKLSDYSPQRQASYWRYIKAMLLAEALVGAAALIGFTTKPWIGDPQDLPILILMAVIMLASFVMFGVMFVRLASYLRLIRAEAKQTQLTENESWPLPLRVYITMRKQETGRG